MTTNNQDRIRIPSTLAGLTWDISALKIRGTVQGYAIEGKETKGDRYDSFEFDVFGSRKVRAETDAKRMTAQAKAIAIELVTMKLRGEGKIV